VDGGGVPPDDAVEGDRATAGLHELHGRSRPDREVPPLEDRLGARLLDRHRRAGRSDARLAGGHRAPAGQGGVDRGEQGAGKEGEGKDEAERGREGGPAGKNDGFFREARAEAGSCAPSECTTPEGPAEATSVGGSNNDWRHPGRENEGGCPLFPRGPHLVTTQRSLQVGLDSMRRMVQFHR